jgi:putative flippase GtrA
MTRSRAFFSIDDAPRKSNSLNALHDDSSSASIVGWAAVLVASASASVGTAYYLNQSLVLPAARQLASSDWFSRAAATAGPAVATTIVLLLVHSGLEQRLAVDRFLEGLVLNWAFALVNIALFPALERIFKGDPVPVTAALVVSSIAQGLVPFLTTFVWEKHAAMYSNSASKPRPTPAPLTLLRKASPYALSLAVLGSVYVGFSS